MASNQPALSEREREVIAAVYGELGDSPSETSISLALLLRHRKIALPEMNQALNWLQTQGKIQAFGSLPLSWKKTHWCDDDPFGPPVEDSDWAEVEQVSDKLPMDITYHNIVFPGNAYDGRSFTFMLGPDDLEDDRKHNPGSVSIADRISANLWMASGDVEAEIKQARIKLVEAFVADQQTKPEDQRWDRCWITTIRITGTNHIGLLLTKGPLGRLVNPLGPDLPSVAETVAAKDLRGISFVHVKVGSDEYPVFDENQVTYVGGLVKRALKERSYSVPVLATNHTVEFKFVTAPWRLWFQHWAMQQGPLIVAAGVALVTILTAGAIALFR